MLEEFKQSYQDILSMLLILIIFSLLLLKTIESLNKDIHNIVMRNNHKSIKLYANIIEISIKNKNLYIKSLALKNPKEIKTYVIKDVFDSKEGKILKIEIF